MRGYYAMVQTEVSKLLPESQRDILAEGGGAAWRVGSRILEVKGTKEVDVGVTEVQRLGPGNKAGGVGCDSRVDKNFLAVVNNVVLESVFVPFWPPASSGVSFSVIGRVTCVKVGVEDAGSLSIGTMTIQSSLLEVNTDEVPVGAQDAIRAEGNKEKFVARGGDSVKHGCSRIRRWRRGKGIGVHCSRSGGWDVGSVYSIRSRVQVGRFAVKGCREPGFIVHFDVESVF